MANKKISQLDLIGTIDVNQDSIPIVDYSENVTKRTNLANIGQRVLEANTTTNLAEGSNLYFTNTRVYTKVKASLLAGSNTSITFDDTLQTITIASQGNVQSVNTKTGAVVLTTTDISEGTNEYHTSARVRAVILTGLSTATNAIISATDSVLSAFGKLQAQITANLSTLTSHTSDTSNPHATTKAQVGLSNVDNTSDANKPISTATQTALNAKQDTLVSGTNIKTIEGQSLLGVGNIDLTKSDVGLGNVDNTSDANKPVSTATQTALDGKVDENTAITGATKTKITYDAKGLVTAGADATTADIADSTNRRYVTDAQLVVVGNTSGTNTGDQTLSGLGGVPTSRTLTINGTTQDLSANRTFTIATGITIGTTPITSGTVGRVLFEGTGNVVSESANLFWDNTNGRFGIAQSTPTARIHIQGSSAATTSSSFVVFNSTPTEIFRIRDNGNVQIGTTTDAGYKLDVNGTARFVSAVTFNNSATNTSGGFVHSSSSPSNDAFYTLFLGSIRFYVRSNGYCKTTTSIVTDANGLGSVDASAISQIDSTTKGFLPPRMTTTQKNAIATPAAGLMVYDTTLNVITYYNGTTWV